MRRFVVLAWTLAAGALVVGGCHVAPAYGGKKVACSADADCRSLGTDYTCQPEGFCARPAGADGGVGDGGVGDGGTGDGGTPVCNPACDTGQTCTDSGCVASADLVVTITAPVAGDVVGDDPEVHSLVEGAVGSATTVTCVAANGAPVAATDQGGDFVCTPDLSAVGEGEAVTITVTAHDAASRTASDSVDVTHDSQPPAVKITDPTGPDGFYVPAPGDLPVAATASDATLTDLHLTYLDPAGTSHEVKDCPASATSATCNSAISLAAGVDAPGTYTLVAIATDAAGHQGKATLDFKIDGTPPTVGIASIPSHAVRRDRDAPITVQATDAETSVATVTLSVVGGGPGGADLDVPGTAGGTAGQTLFTVTGRNGAATPVLDAAVNTWAVHVVATDAWGNSASADGSLTVTRLAWHTDLVSSGTAGILALSPAVAADGTVYVVLETGGANDLVYTLAPGTGTPTELAKTARPVLAGPVLDQTATGVARIYLLEQQSVVSATGLLEAIGPDGNQVWTYPGTGSTASVVGLPTLATGGDLYVPISVPPAINGGSSQFCIDEVVAKTLSRDGAGCLNAAWSRVSLATSLATGNPDMSVAVDRSGKGAVISCGVGPNVGRCSVLTQGQTTGQTVGAVMATAQGFYVTGGAGGGATGAGQASGFPWTANLTQNAPVWHVSLEAPTTGVVGAGGLRYGGLAGNVWTATATNDQTLTTVALPQAGAVASVSVGTLGRTYDLVQGTSAAYVVALGPPPDMTPLWRFPGDPTAALPNPAPKTTAVLGPTGILVVPDGKGGVTALITDSAHRAAGWSNVRGDPARTSTTGR